MKTRNLLILFSLLHYSLLFSQRQAYSTINGNCFQFFSGGCDVPQANMILKFNDDSLEQIIEPLDLNLSTLFSRAAFSDTNGNLIFASNGWRLVDSEGNILSNKLWRDEMPHPGDSPETTMVRVTLGPLFLNDPGDPTKAYLFYGEYELYQFPPYTLTADTYFSYAYLDIPTKSLISQENTILNTPTQNGNMQACRHANGRDWWLIKPGINQNSFFIGLLDPSGISMQEIIIPQAPETIQARTFSQFSFEGDKFVHFAVAPNRILYTYDFDRCAGELSNMQMHDLGDSLNAGDINAFALSPDGSKVYIKKANFSTEPQQVEGTLQYDLNTNEYYYVSQFSSAPFLTPNGKTVLIQSFEGGIFNNTLSEIMNPNEAGVNCNIIEHKYSVQNNATFVMPSNYANFKLGALEGSSCDSLSVGVPTNLDYPALRFKVYPNPVESTLTIEQDIPSLLELRITDMLGRTLWQGKTSEHTTILSKEIETLQNGIYWIEIQDLESGKRGGKRFLKQ